MRRRRDFRLSNRKIELDAYRRVVRASIRDGADEATADKAARNFVERFRKLVRLEQTTGKPDAMAELHSGLSLIEGGAS